MTYEDWEQYHARQKGKMMNGENPFSGLEKTKKVVKNDAADEVAEIHNSWRKNSENLKENIKQAEEHLEGLRAQLSVYLQALDCALYPNQSDRAVAKETF